MKYALAILIICVITVPTFAQWQSWGKYKGQTIYYQRLVRNRSIVKVWIRKGRSKGSAYLAFDCSNNKVRQIQASKNGELFDDWGKYYYVEPGTLSEWLYQKACP